VELILHLILVIQQQVEEVEVLQVLYLELMVDLQVEDLQEELPLVQEELQHREPHHKVEQVLDLMLVQDILLHQVMKAEEEEVEQAE
jgi:hypothetical protein